MVLAEQNLETQTQEVEMTVSPAAVAVIKNLLQERNIPDYSLRIFVTGGGCSGMQYGMSFEENAREYDKIVSVDNVSILVDPTSLVYLEGATIDFVDSLIGGGFRIENPNAVSSCGCGSSFKTKDDAGAASDESCNSCSSY